MGERLKTTCVRTFSSITSPFKLFFSSNFAVSKRVAIVNGFLETWTRTIVSRAEVCVYADRRERDVLVLGPLLSRRFQPVTGSNRQRVALLIAAAVLPESLLVSWGLAHFKELSVPKKGNKHKKKESPPGTLAPIAVCQTPPHLPTSSSTSLPPPSGIKTSPFIITIIPQRTSSHMHQTMTHFGVGTMVGGGGGWSERVMLHKMLSTPHSTPPFQKSSHLVKHTHWRRWSHNSVGSRVIFSGFISLFSGTLFFCLPPAAGQSRLMWLR